ncbi:MAG: hypothetical protein ACTHKT_00550 [Solirubrobacterales bacterium]
MHKQLMLACMAIVAFAAFVIAPVASASPVLTSEGKVVPIGTSITGVNTGATKLTVTKGGSALECDHDHLAGTVAKNSGTKITGEIPVGSAEFDGTGTNTDCTGPFGPFAVTVKSKLCWETGEITTPNGTKDADGITITGCGANVTFTMNITGIALCRYLTASMSGTYTTNTTPATVNVSEQPLTSDGVNPFPCPSDVWLDMDFDLYTTSGVGLTIS